MKNQLEQQIADACRQLFDQPVAVELTRPDGQFGDYATNAALQLAKPLGQNPRQIAEQLSDKLRPLLADKVSQITVAGPGFINLRLTDQTLIDALRSQPGRPLDGQSVVAEYSDPNPFKVLHAGHLYTSVVGDAIANLMDQAGGQVHRVNFGGDVGLHVGKTMWAILQKLGGANPAELTKISENDRAAWMAEAYIAGTQAYEDDETAKAAIIDLNKQIYRIHNDDDRDSPLAQIYWTCRQWSYDYFNSFYDRIGTHFEKYYPESQTAPIGLATVKEHIGPVYEESDGAVIFAGDKHGLHTRVFINSEGLPTYEAKDVGLIMLKDRDYHYDKSVIITGNEQEQYLAVVLKSIEQFAPELVSKTTHLTHGIVKLQGGVKMSSRKGNILRAVDVLEAAAVAGQKLGNNQPEVILGAVKYAFLKTRMGGDIIYDPEESVSLEGNSGPYLQYAHARARSILRKAESQAELMADFQPAERALLNKLTEFSEVADRAMAELMPHHIATYLYELAQAFNSFYEHNRVIGDERQAQRLALVNHYADTLKRGLGILGITAPEQM